MARPGERIRNVASILVGLGGVLLVASLTLPIARQGVGSALSLHELFDLLLSGSLPLGVPRWLGLLGYLPALGGVCLLISEAFNGRVRRFLQVLGLAVALVAVAALVLLGPWNRLALLGPGSWLGISGGVLASAGVIFGRDRRGRATLPSGQMHSDNNGLLTTEPHEVDHRKDEDHALPTLRT